MIESTSNKLSFVIGETPVFPFNIRFFKPEDIKCYIQSDGIERMLDAREFSIENKSEYDHGANITLLMDPLPVGSTLIIVRECEIVQDVSFPTNGKFPSKGNENALDKLTMIAQQLAEKLSRALVATPAFSGSPIDYLKNIIAAELDTLSAEDVDAYSKSQIDTIISRLPPGSGTVTYGYIDSRGRFQAVDLSGDKPVDISQNATPAGIGIYSTPFLPDDMTLQPFTVVAKSLNASMQLATDSPSEYTNVFYKRYLENDWKLLAPNVVITLDLDDPVQIMSTVEKFNTSSYHASFRFEGAVELRGNIMSLINWSTTLPEYVFHHLFSEAGTIDASNLVLPAETLSAGCYQSMFAMSALTKAPQIRATAAGTRSMAMMFYYCTSLATPPVLNITELTGRENMMQMFLNSGITVCPNLPAQVLTPSCYAAICKNTKITAFTLPDLIPAKGCLDGAFHRAPVENATVHFTQWWEPGIEAEFFGDWISFYRYGNFYKPATLPLERGFNRIPNEWTVYNIEEAE